MNLILFVSLVIRLIAMGWSILLLQRMKNWRMSFLTALLGFMVIHPILTLFEYKVIHSIVITSPFTELSELVISFMVLLFVFYLERIFTQQKQVNESVKSQNELLHEVLLKIPIVVFKIDEDGIIRESIGTGFARLGQENNVVGMNTLIENPHIEAQVLKALSGESVHYESHDISENGAWWYDNFLTRDSNGGKGAIGFSIDITEHKLAVEALKEIESKYKALINVLPDLIFTICSDGTYLDFLPANKFDALVHPKKFLGKKIYDMLPGDVAKNAMQFLERTLQTGDLQIFDYQLQKNGHIHNYEARLILSSKNEILAIVRNITDRKRVEKALHESEDRYRSLIENAPFCILEIDRNGNMTSMNSIGLKMMGVKNMAKIVDHAFLDIVAPEDRERVSHLLNNAYKGQPSQFEFLGKSAIGSRIFASSFIPLKGVDSRIEKVISITEDITKRKRTEEQFRKLYHAVEQSPSMVMIIDPFGVIEHVNPKFTEVTGYSAEEILGTNATEIGDIFAQDYEKIWQILNAGKEWRGEFYNKKKNGEFYWEFASISSIKNSDGEITHYIKVAEDLTDRKKLEEQLLQSQKMEAIGRLAGGVAHDFNNLLTAISGYSDFLLNELDLNDPKRQDIEEIQKAGERAATLTRQLLAFSRKQMLQLERLDLNKTIKDLLDMLKRVIGENIDLKINLDVNLAAVRADSGQIQQALLNLCLNARDAMPKGGQLTIETHNLTKKQLKVQSLPLNPKQNYVQINIIDTGIGMDKNTLKQIFEPFYTTKELGKGTGLGLAVVYGIVKQHKGHIEVESRQGKGTSFNIYFPSDSDAEIGKKAINNSHKLRNDKKTILVAEDDETVRNVAVRILMGQGYKILMAKNGLEAIKVFEDESERVDLVILDVVMPKCSGPEAYEKLRLIKPDVPVIFTTGYDVKAELDELGQQEQEHVSVLQKPYTKETLGNTVRELLDI
ncbi:MAG: PAS domain S-box protein [bacterium]